MKEYNKANNTPCLPLFDDLQNPIRSRLKSRKNPLITARSQETFSIEQERNSRWSQCGLSSPFFATTINRGQEIELPRRSWINLNRLHTKHGCCNDLMYKWKFKTDPGCPCGHPKRTTDHIWNECPVVQSQSLLEQLTR